MVLSLLCWISTLRHFQGGSHRGATLPAEHAFRDAVTRAEGQLRHTPQNYDALDTEALALAGLTLTGPTDHAAEAARLFTAARHITGAAGIATRVLRRLDTLTAGDLTGTLDHVRPAARGASD